MCYLNGYRNMADKTLEETEVDELAIEIYNIVNNVFNLYNW